jgi:hypothetical protein
MSETRNPAAAKGVVYQLPGTEAVTIQRDLVYQTEAGPQSLDLYLPADTKPGVLRAAVILVSGFPDPGFQKVMGCKFKEMESSVTWGRLFAASGLIGVTYSNEKPSDLFALLTHIKENASSLGIDVNRIGVWGTSGHVPMALSGIFKEPSLFRCAALCYGFMLEAEGTNHVKEAAAKLFFTNLNEGKTVSDFPENLPLYIVRAGQDRIPTINVTIDAFVSKALQRNLPLTLCNASTSPHAFDLFDDRDISRDLIRGILSFLVSSLR